MANISDVMEFIVDNSHSELEPEDIAEIFDKLIWTLDDNGESLLRVQSEWLRGECKKRILIALSMKEVFPYDTEEALQEGFALILTKFPDLKSMCDQIHLNWKKQFSG